MATADNTAGGPPAESVSPSVGAGGGGLMRGESSRIFRAVLGRISACGDQEISLHRLTLATIMAHAGLYADHVGEGERNFYCVEACILEPMVRAAMGEHPDPRSWS